MWNFTLMTRLLRVGLSCFTNLMEKTRRTHRGSANIGLSLVANSEGYNCGLNALHNPSMVGFAVECQRQRLERLVARMRRCMRLYTCRLTSQLSTPSLRKQTKL